MKHTIVFAPILLAVTLLSTTTSAYGWGQTGHRITGAIAEQYLSETSKTALSKLLPNESLAEASTYADEMRSNPSKYWQKTASPWHYVTIADGKTYKRAPKRGDSLSALKTFRKTLLSKNTSIEEKQLALRFTIHLIGDMHQPMHAGNSTDRGGNNVKLEFFWQASNLHRVWDSGMIDQRKLSFTEWSKWLTDKITTKNIANWSKATPLNWIEESAAIRKRVYPEKDAIAYRYQHQNLPIVNKRLQQAGVRLASYLNDIYK